MLPPLHLSILLYLRIFQHSRGAVLTVHSMFFSLISILFFRVKMQLTLLLALYAVTLVTAGRIPIQPDVTKSNKCDECSYQICFPVIGCKDGYIGKDSCNCCDTCIKTKQLSKCGGIMNIHGQCGSDLVCNIRHPNSHENTPMMPGQKIGRCEKGKTIFYFWPLYLCSTSVSGFRTPTSK